MPLRKFVAPEIIFGAGAIDLVGQYARNFSGRNILLVSDRGVKAAGWVEKTEDSLRSMGLRVTIFDEVSENPKIEEVMSGARLYEDEDCDLIVAVGGGSPMDCGKAIGAVASNKCHVLKFEGVDMVPVPGPPMICIPTTAGSSADVSQFAIITDEETKRKFAIISKSMVPDVSLIDPLTTTTMTRKLTVSSGLDALSHSFESYVSNASSPLTDLYALEAARLLSSNLPKVFEEPSEMHYREAMMLGSMYAGLAFSNASLGLAHAMSHSIGGFYDAAHGQCTAILLEIVVGFNYPAVPERYNDLEMAISGGKIEGLSAKSLVRKLRDLRYGLGIDCGLKSLGFRTQDIPYLSRNAFLDPCLATNPRPTALHDIEGLYEAAL